MKGVILASVMFSLFLPMLMTGNIDDHASGRGARQFMRDAVNENKSIFEEISLSLDGV